MSVSRSLVPAAAPVIVETLRAGPLTWKELWKQCTSNAAVVRPASADSTTLTPLQRSFQSKSNLKKRILPVLLAQGLIERHAITSQSKILDPTERAQRLADKTLHRHTLASSASLSGHAATAGSPVTSSATASSSSSSSSSRHTTEFVWAVPHALLDEGAQHPALRDPATTARLTQHLEALTTGRETVIELSAKVRAMRAAEKIEEEAGKRYPIPTLQASWERPVGTVVSAAGSSNGAQWVTSRGEKRHLNKRRALSRIGKERKMQTWWDALEQAKVQGGKEATA
ncbi:hypothetical protein QFC19_000763 [Naganishia cerealis]|uniref:Uncharacterized protein n=1 Tax=Naganishia cerealis TaxID=610337 RepID=A0ACC2WKV0_9TREE|nr:hypothetical protein QFC19_000763 [Naganishia cerealis]